MPTNRNSSCHFLSFPNSLIRAKNRFVKNGTANFDRNIPTEINGPPPEVIPNISLGRNRNVPFHLNSDRNFRNLWHNGKQPVFVGFISRNLVLKSIVYSWILKYWNRLLILMAFSVQYLLWFFSCDKTFKKEYKLCHFRQWEDHEMLYLLQQMYIDLNLIEKFSIEVLKM